ncbi:MAG TPA: group III truncated hemoglobin [Oxalicibacterium sp.]|nr:group III truncated hemoglobin [Oxalicibacterium sp.]HWU98374.1 group III truncated hemoglobin [Oxalicibacterium sp.]
MNVAPDICTDEEIKTLVHTFYAEVRRDDLIGPVFNQHIDDWDHHLARLVDFWSSILRGTGRYSGTPMQKHIALPELNPALFERWLSLFNETLSKQPNAAMRERASAAAQRIAQSLWYAWQMDRAPEKLPSDLKFKQ